MVMDQEGKSFDDVGQTHNQEMNPSNSLISTSCNSKETRKEETILVLGDSGKCSRLNINAGRENDAVLNTSRITPLCRGLLDTEFEFGKGLDDDLFQEDELENIDPRCISQSTNALLGKVKGFRGRRSNPQKREERAREKGIINILDFMKKAKGEGFSLDAIGSAGGLSVVWNPANVEVVPIASHENWMACEIKGIGTNLQFPFFNVYGPTKTKDKLKVWREITMQASLVEKDKAIIAGDFNALLDVDEKD
ncbi:hypothetical protein SUGI_0314210 [Cryptomeria japonica]|nr:hypothetical protein SUGI_0314210 [Cryptomeria japonica]